MLCNAHVDVADRLDMLIHQFVVVLVGFTMFVDVRVDCMCLCVGVCRWISCSVLCFMLLKFVLRAFECDAVICYVAFHV